MIAAKGNVLVVIAHPDDEVFASGTICLCRQSGFKATVVTVTDGEGGGHQLFGEAERRSHLRDVRARELELSALTLGIDSIVRLGFPDIPMESWDDSCWDKERLVSLLANQIVDHEPHLVLTHGPRGGYGHPAHKEVFRCVMAAVRDARFAGSVFSFGAQARNTFFAHLFDQPSDILVDVREFHSRRAMSLGYHQSQTGFFLEPAFRPTARGLLSALFGMVFGFTQAGRRRTPIGTPSRFFKKFPLEGLAIQQVPQAQPHFFQEYFAGDARVRPVSELATSD